MKIENLKKIIEKINKIQWEKIGQWHTSLLMDYSCQETHNLSNMRRFGLPFGFKDILFIGGEQYFNKTELEKGKEYFLEKISENLNYLAEFKKFVFGLTDNAVKYYNSLGEIDFSGKETVFLIKKINEFKKTVEDLFVLSYTYIAFERAIEETLKKKLRGLKIKNAVDFLPDLMIPRGTSLMIKENKDFFKIIETISKDANLKKIFNGPANLVQNELKEKYKNIFKKINSHRDEYAWMNVVNWVGEPHSLDYYFDRIQAALKNDYLKNRQKEFIKQQKEKELKYEKLIKKFAIKGNLKKLIELARDHLELKMYRWDIMSITGYKARPLLNEAARRSGIKLDDLWYLTFDELIDALKGRCELESGWLNILKERKDNYLLFKEKDKISIFVGTEFEKISKSINPAGLSDFVVSEIKGEAAYKGGKIVGRVRIVKSANYVNKMKKDEILVCPMTDPDFMPAITKAKAIITDQGGILCHAAIISREMKIPCIINTKIATKVLKDGDWVEVDAEQGVVKILKKAR